MGRPLPWTPGRLLALLLLALASVPGVPGGLLPPAPPLHAAERWDRKRAQDLAERWFAARPATRFERWDPATRQALVEEAEAFGGIPEGSLAEVVDVLWKAARRHAPRPRKTEIETPYGRATWIQGGRGGRKVPLLLGLHGGGPGAGSAGEAAGNWPMPGALSLYPQGIRLVDDTWNAVHGETFALTLVDLAKVCHEVDPDRVYVAGFSMGGTGALHLAGRCPDLFAGAIPAHGVVMASPNSRVATAEEVEQIQYGLLPNLRNVAVYLYTGLADRNCPPGTFLKAWDLLQEHKARDPGGYEDIRFQAYPDLPHAFPPGEPATGLAWIAGRRRTTFPRKIVWEYAADPFPLPDAEDKVRRRPVEWFYWLHCARPVDAMEIVAERRGNEIDLSVALAFPEDVTVYLNPEMVDVGQDVVLRLRGKEVWRGRPVPDLASVLVSLDARLDRRMVFDRRVRVPE